MYECFQCLLLLFLYVFVLVCFVFEGVGFCRCFCLYCLYVVFLFVYVLFLVFGLCLRFVCFVCFLCFRPWLKELALFDLNIELCMPKSPPESLPEVWKREICIKYEDFKFQTFFCLIRSWGLDLARAS